ncbi:MAG: pseudouridine synthase [Hahellaceae bacterium]|nr:pseudouridine synthase [Hahellaceae bacterium]MCP5212600.1 pseudouridine synthase [Hahellaceae bacterium]
MRSKSARLDRFLSEAAGIRRRDVRRVLAQGRVALNGFPAFDIQQRVGEFCQVSLDGELLQNKQPRYLMLHKPKGVVSATIDHQHTTVVDLLDEKDRHDMHIAGRLDLHSSGLLLLTNDGRFSRYLTLPEQKIAKVYKVEVEHPITDAYAPAFAEGMYFGYEDITTLPAKLVILSETVAEVTLVEGRYHQIKRMFGRFRNPVLALHRLSIGNILLDESLMPGDYRPLTQAELSGFYQHLNALPGQ